jgi:PAS domain S-box-containing protein
VKPLSNRPVSRRERALLADTQAATQRLSTMLESISDGYIALDRAWACTALNNKACESMGMSRDEILGRRIWDLYPDTIGTSFEAAMRRAATERETVVFDYYYPGRDRWYENRVYPSEGGVSMFFAEITERKRAEEILVQSEERFRALAENTSLLVWTCTPDRRCDYVSPQFELYTGISLLGDWRLELVHPDDRAGMLAAWEHTMSEAGAVDFELRMRRHDEVWRWFQVGLVPLRAPDGQIVKWLGTCTDINDRKRAVDALLASEKSLAKDLALMKTLQEVSTRLVREVDAEPPLLEIVDAAIAITSADMGNIQLLDHGSGALRIAASRGFDRPFLRFFDTVHEGQAACGQAVQRGARLVIGDITTSPVFVGTPALDVLVTAGVRGVQSTPLVCRSAQLLGVLSTHYRTPHVPTDQELHLLDVLVRQAADWVERTQSQKELRLAKKALEEADRRKDEFLAVLAHELRNPLASVMAGSRLLRRSTSSAIEAERTRDMIEHEVGQLSQLVDDLLDVSGIATGRVVLRCEAVDLRKVLHRVVESTRPLFEGRKHGLQFDVPREPVRVRGDAVRLVQVFANLLANAARYTPAEGRISFTAGMAGRQAVVRILDSGIGIAPADLPYIFDLFNRIERSRDHAEGGLGIGLTISRRLVEMHNGSLEAFSDGPGCGSEFVVRLPLVHALPKDETMPLPALLARGPPRSHRILLVDDNEAFATAMASLLSAMGHDVQVIHDGGAAIGTARALRPQVVLLDINLPGKRGYDIAREIRADPAFAGTLLIAVTGYGQERDKHHAQQAGFDHHLTKPVDESVLERLLNEALAE